MTSAALAGDLAPVEKKLKEWQPGPELPSWFAAYRSRARDAYFDFAPPDKSDKVWHYGEPKRFNLDGLDIARAKPQKNGYYEAVLAQSDDQNNGVCLCMAGNTVEQISSNGALRNTGVEVMSLRQALASHGELVEHHWDLALLPFERDKVTASHFALLENGFFVHVPEGVEAHGPIHLVIEAGEPGSVSAPHVLVIAGKRSRAEVYVHFVGSNDEARDLVLGVVQTHVADGAELTLTKMQHLGSRTDALTHEVVQLGRDAAYKSAAVLLGGHSLRHEAVAGLAQPGSSAKLYGMYILRNRERYDFYTHQHHKAPDTVSDLLFKGSLLGRSRASYLGSITVNPEAQRTDAYQRNRSLLLSPQARVNSSPQLEILANEVRCSHGSTVSNIGEDELFYMQTRGVDEEHCRKLLVSGFLAEVVDVIPMAALRDYAYNYIAEHLL